MACASALQLRLPIQQGGGGPRLKEDVRLSACLTQVKEVWDTFVVMARLGTQCVEAYVISMAGSVSDILAVELLKREACRKVRASAQGSGSRISGAGYAAWSGLKVWDMEARARAWQVVVSRARRWYCTACPTPDQARLSHSVLQVAGEQGKEVVSEQLGVRVVPLLETLKDLDNAASVVSGLLQTPWYRTYLRYAILPARSLLLRCCWP